MAAVGLVALANATQRPELAGCALTKYSEAINNINAALASPVESVKDSTLMSVISLGVFEHVSRQESWARHVLGAAAIMVARGKSQFSSPVAIRMFNQVRADLVTACLHWRGARPFPEDMLELQGEANKHADMSNATWLVGVMGPRCAVLLTRVRKNNGGIPWTELLEEATVIERDLRHAVGILAIQEPYTTTRNSGWDPSIVYNGRLDYYRDFWAIRVWNNSRNLQMVLYEILCFLLNKVLATDLAPTAREHMELKLRETLQAQSKLGEDVLATVPQTLKFVSSTSGAQSSVYPSFYGSVSGGYMLTWCLYVVGTSVATKSEARKWIIRCLQDIGRNMGISMALELVEDVIKISQCAG